MSRPELQIVGHVYVVTEEASALLQQLFQGRGAGAVVVVEPATFRALRDGVLTFPIHVVADRGGIILPGEVPKAS